MGGDSSGEAAFAQVSEGERLWGEVSLWVWPLRVALTRREELSLEEQRGLALAVSGFSHLSLMTTSVTKDPRQM